MEIFNRNSLLMHRKKSAKFFNDYSFLFENSAEFMMEELSFHSRKFHDILEIGSKNGFALKYIPNNFSKKPIQAEFSHEMNLENSHDSLKVTMDEEKIAFKNDHFDLIYSILNLHWVNDLPGAMIQIQRILKDNAVFVASIFGPNSLIELKESLFEVEEELGMPHVARIGPFVDVKSFASLATRAGFKEPVTNSRIVKVEYYNAFKLFEDLKGMGETNILKKMSSIPMRKEITLEVEKKLGCPFTVSFEIVSLHCFK